MKKVIGSLIVLGILAPVFSYSATIPSYEDGTLLKSSDGKVWVTCNNKRRWIINETIFTANGYSWSAVQDISDIELAKLPFNNLIRAADDVKVFAMNDSGYKRWIQNPDIFASYGMDWNDVCPTSQAEINAHPNTDLIKVAGRDTIYDLNNEVLRPIKDLPAFSSLGKNWVTQQIINETDFATYALGDELSTVAGAPEQPVNYAAPSPYPSVSPSPSPIAGSPSPSPSPSVPEPINSLLPAYTEAELFAKIRKTAWLNAINLGSIVSVSNISKDSVVISRNGAYAAWGDARIVFNDQTILTKNGNEIPSEMNGITFEIHSRDWVRITDLAPDTKYFFQFIYPEDGREDTVITKSFKTLLN